jgi:mannose-6-phosphate isomerase class I
VADGRFCIAIVTSGSGFVEGDFGRQAVRRGETFAWPASLALRVRADREPVRVVRCMGPKL